MGLHPYHIVTTRITHGEATLTGGNGGLILFRLMHGGPSFLNRVAQGSLTLQCVSGFGAPEKVRLLLPLNKPYEE
jgi:hypothetical protein